MLCLTTPICNWIPGERVGLIGRNGGGKSSLLRALASEIKLDDGKLWRAPNLKLAYVSQEPILNPTNTVYQEVSNGLGQYQPDIAGLSCDFTCFK
jgi:ATPase subunit of ABC transporter with duplicated ATPase domains